MIKHSYSHDAWPLRLLAFTMFAIGTTFEVLYLSGRACLCRGF
jgi:hypothetical protein